MAGLIDKVALTLVERTQPYIAASSLYEAGDLSGAVRITDQIIVSMPHKDESVVWAYSLKGFIASDQHKLDEAISEYRQAIQLDPKSALPHNVLGNMLSDQGKAEEAISEYRQAIQLDPKDAVPHYNLGNVLLNQGKTEEAISEYRQAIQLDPKDESAMGLLSAAIMWERIQARIEARPPSMLKKRVRRRGSLSPGRSLSF